MKSEYLLFFALIIIYSCNEKEEREIIVDNKFKAIGAISSDSVYNGVIKFYDINTNQLLFSSTYKNGMLDGQKIDYYENGKIYSKQNYANGKLSQEIYFFDKSGFLYSSQYFYHGIKVGPDISWKTGILKDYSFYSLDNELLFYLNYDSIEIKKLSDIQEQFFFFHSSNFFFQNDSSTNRRKEYFIYLLQPPRFKFEYSVVQIDSNFNVLSTEFLLDQKEVWSMFSINSYQESKYALKLYIKDSINEANYTMFKRL